MTKPTNLITQVNGNFLTRLSVWVRGRREILEAGMRTGSFGHGGNLGAF